MVSARPESAGSASTCDAVVGPMHYVLRVLHGICFLWSIRLVTKTNPNSVSTTK